MNVNRCFYYTKLNVIFSFVVFCHSFHFPSDITMFSLKSENIPFWSFFQKGPKCCTLHMKVLSHRCEVLPEREWMTEKKKKALETMPIHSTEQYWRWEGGCFRFSLFCCCFLFLYFFSFYFFAATIILNKCHHIWPAHIQLLLPPPPQKNATIID